MSKTIDPQLLKPMFTDAVLPPSPIQRWMYEGDIVSFTNPRRFPGGNAEFQINGNPKWLIWFSQLYTVFYNGDLDNGSVCSFKLKDGSYIFPRQLPFEKFWDIIEGKRFKVSVDPTPCFRVNRNEPKVGRFDTEEDVYRYVHERLLSGDRDSVRKMLKPTSCYDLVEI